MQSHCLSQRLDAMVQPQGHLRSRLGSNLVLQRSKRKHKSLYVTIKIWSGFAATENAQTYIIGLRFNPRLKLAATSSSSAGVLLKPGFFIICPGGPQKTRRPQTFRKSTHPCNDVPMRVSLLRKNVPQGGSRCANNGGSSNCLQPNCRGREGGKV